MMILCAYYKYCAMFVLSVTAYAATLDALRSARSPLGDRYELFKSLTWLSDSVLTPGQPQKLIV